MKLSFEAAQTEIKTNPFFGQSQRELCQSYREIFFPIGEKNAGANRTFASIDIE